MTNRMRMGLGIVALLAFTAPARAEVQKGTPQVFPGKFLIGVRPVGVSIDLRSGSAAYKLAFDFAVRVVDAKVGLYVGGGLDYAVAGRGNLNCPLNNNCNFVQHDLQPWVFALLTFEKLIPIPLVPFVQIGVGTDLFWHDADFVAGGFAFRFGAGFDYWLTKNVGVGAETHFTFGPSFSHTDPITVSFYAQWDFLLGARFAF